MAKLTGSLIKKLVIEGKITIDPFNVAQIGPNSYDLTLGSELRIYRDMPDYHSGFTPLDSMKENPTKSFEINETYGFVLHPGTLYLGHTNEIAGSREYVPCIEGRSSMARLGIQVHLTAGFGDVGFINQWTLEILVVKPVRVYRNLRICQIYFDTVVGEIDQLYDGKYTKSMGAVASKSWMDHQVEPEPLSMNPIPANPDSAPIMSGPTKRFCSVCRDQQYYTPSGWTCQNGHGGAPEMNEDDVSLNLQYTCRCGAQFVAAEDGIKTCWSCGKNI